MAVLHISEADLVRDVHAVLDRVQSGEEVVIERDARPVAILRAPDPRRKLSEIAASLAENSPGDKAVDDYSRIREEMIASGLPMLSDDEVRAEIQERKGARGDSDD